MSKYRVAVRDLCEFAARRGDLDLRFAPGPSAQQGQAGHQRVAAARGPGYRSEIALSTEFEQLVVRGRADGFDPAQGRVDEVKTHRGSIERQPANVRALHWAQAKVYGWLICLRDALPQLQVALVYLDIDSQNETVLTESFVADELQAHFESLCRAFAAWADSEMAHRLRRDDALRQLAFPLGALRSGQRALAESVYRAATAGQCLLAQAPTGVGKTLGTLFPALKAMPGARLDRVFFVTAKTSGRSVAVDALRLLQSASAGAIRALELVARDKACEHPGAACTPEACPLARGFHDRLPGARAAALTQSLWDRGTLRALAQAHAICPYWLGQELARWSDVVVGDYNHFFDASALLHGLTQAQDWRVALLVDEAHNLLPRAREMYSASLQQAVLATLRKSAPAPLRPPLSRVQRAWSALVKQLSSDYQVLAAPPERLLLALQQAAAAIGDHLAADATAAAPDLQRWYFDALRFTRLAESFGSHSLFDVSRSAAGSTLCLRNVLPALFLRARFETARSTTLFSATLQPAHFHRDMLGLPQSTRTLDIDSPFEAAQLQVLVAPISTRFAQRDRSVDRIVERMAAQYAERAGNYLAFFSSYAYLAQVAERFAALHAQVPAWAQQRGMSSDAQQDFLARFEPGGRGIGFAVLGGAFAEGIDLPGDRLIGAFVATLGMPQVNPVNEEMRRRIEAICGNGFEYTYLYPGLQRVVQAAGRVIRSASDSGVVHLLDERYARRAVRELLPAWWH